MTIAPTSPTTHILRVSLRGRLYRDIEIRSNASLHDLAEAIVRSFDFDLDHAFGFFSKLTGNIFQSPVRYELFADLELDAGGPSRSVKRTRIEQAFPRVGSLMTFLFDYGDEWRFKAAVIGIRKPELNARYPKVVKAMGVAPVQYPAVDDEEC
jgi:hypothetical protein